MRYTIFGESHGPAIGVVLEGLPSGLALDMAAVEREMARRAPGRNPLSTARKEADRVEILSGLFEGRTCGTPLCAVIANTDTRSGDYQNDLPRPGHADYTAQIRYGGFQDYRGGGHFSGRLTAPMVFAGAVMKLWLRGQGIEIGSHILRLGPIEDIPFDLAHPPVEEFPAIAARTLPVLSEEAGERMQAAILKAREELTSAGGVMQVAVTGVPAGIGSPDESLEGIISRHVFAVPAVKGIEFGLGFGFGSAYGHEVNDEMRMEDGKPVSTTNYNGGILGGISSGMPIVFQAAIKPTPSIAREQKTVDMEKLEDASIRIKGRHDPCILSRAAVVLEAAAALAISEAMLDR